MSRSILPGKIYLVPMPMGTGGEDALSMKSMEILANTRYFLAENPKTCRRQLKVIVPHKDLQACIYHTYNKHTPSDEIQRFLQPVLEGNDLCIVSESGAPCIADPGSAVVRYARKLKVKIIPLSGPSSIIMSLMASGLDGQKFCFHGYLPRDAGLLQTTLKKLEADVFSRSMSQIFMETPYRNERLMKVIISSLKSETLLCIAVDMTTPTEWIECKTIKEWKTDHWPNIQRRPAIFILGTE